MLPSFGPPHTNTGVYPTCFSYMVEFNFPFTEVWVDGLAGCANDMLGLMCQEPRSYQRKKLTSLIRQKERGTAHHCKLSNLQEVKEATQTEVA